MAEVTEADLDKAYRALWPLTRYRWPRDDEITDEQRAQVERVAAALAVEREKERAPFLALADRWEEFAHTRVTGPDARKMLGAVADIRRAAGVTD